MINKNNKLEMNKKEERKYLKAEEEKHKNRSFLARIFFSKDGQLSGIKSGLFFLTIVIIAFVSELYLKKMYIGEECSLGYAGSWTEKKCVKQPCYYKEIYYSRFNPSTRTPGLPTVSNLILLDSYIYSDEKRECIPKCNNKQYWKEGKCYSYPYYKHISNEVLKEIDKEEKDLEQYFLKKLQMYKEENK